MGIYRLTFFREFVLSLGGISAAGRAKFGGTAAGSGVYFLCRAAIARVEDLLLAKSIGQRSHCGFVPRCFPNLK